MLCNDPEMRHLVAMLPRAHGLYEGMPGVGTPLRPLVLETTLLLERKGLILAALLRLRDEYPLRVAEIYRVAAMITPRHLLSGVAGREGPCYT